MEFIWYPKCSTCKNAKKYLEEKNIKCNLRDIKIDTPSINELNNYIDKYKLDVNKLFNTSGIVYRDLDLKNKLKDMSKEEKIKILSSNGMLIKRPLLIMDDKILIGFKIKEYESYFNK